MSSRKPHGLSRRGASAVLTVIALASGAIVLGAPASTAASNGAIDPYSINTTQWMDQISGVIGDRPLNKIVMPGSHDAGSWGINPASGICETGYAAGAANKLPGVAASISVTQASNIVQQLNNGSRYLDLRLCKQNGRWYPFHGGPMGRLFFDDPATSQLGEMDQVAQWIRDHPREIVTIELTISAPADTDPSDGYDTHAADYREAVNKMAQAIGTSRMADKYKLSPSSTYNQFMNAGSNVVLIDDTNCTDNAWAWANNTIEERDSYLENKDNVALLNNLFGSPSPYGSAVTQLSAQALNQDHKSLRTKAGDPNKFFLMSGVVDSYTMLPGAVKDFANAGLGWNPGKELPYMLQLAKEHDTNMLKLLEGEWRYSYIARNTNIVEVDFIDMGGLRDNGSIIGTGDLARAIIANNTPLTKPGTLVSAERRSDGTWAETQPLPGVNANLEQGVLEFGGGERAAAAMPNGDVQVIAYGPDGHMYHNIRKADGSWQGWARPNSDAVDKNFANSPLAITSTPNGDAHMLAIGKDGYLYHNIRLANGSWQPNGWSAVPGPDNGRFKAKDVAITSMPNGVVKVAAFSATDGAMRVAERWANGTWSIEVQGWQTVTGVGGAQTFAGKDLSISGTKDNTVRFAAVGNDGRIYEMTRDVRGNQSAWRSPEWKPGDAMQATGVALTALPDGTAQLLAVGMDGNVWHTAAGTDGKWSAFGLVPGIHGRPLGATGATITALPNGTTYTLVGAR